MRLFILGALALLAACADQRAPDRNDLPHIAGEETQSASPPAAPVAAPRPAETQGSLAARFDTTAEGAADLVRTYFALLEQKRFSDAHTLWTTGLGDLADETFAAQFDRYADYQGLVGEPGRVEGAAGSLYVTVPVQTSGTLKTGEKLDEPVIVTLRRVNDVPGSTAEQRRWHITKVDQP